MSKPTPHIGHEDKCALCGRVIRYTGKYWVHVVDQPRHVARPAEQYDPEPVVLVRRDGVRREPMSAHDAAIYLWGRDLRDHAIYLLVPGAACPREITDLEQYLTQLLDLIRRTKSDSDTDEHKLATAVSALERIAESDPGPAYYIARNALNTIMETKTDAQRQQDQQAPGEGPDPDLQVR